MLTLNSDYPKDVVDPMRLTKDDLLAILEFLELGASQAYANSEKMKLMKIDSWLVITSYRKGCHAIRIPKRAIPKVISILKETLDIINSPY
jgi:hypothetical protein